eukprot:3482247-Amphidinium_carterae.2
MYNLPSSNKFFGHCCWKKERYAPAARSEDGFAAAAAVLPHLRGGVAGKEISVEQLEEHSEILRRRFRNCFCIFCFMFARVMLGQMCISDSVQYSTRGDSSDSESSAIILVASPTANIKDSTTRRLLAMLVLVKTCQHATQTTRLQGRTVA